MGGGEGEGDYVNLFIAFAIVLRREKKSDDK
jgi:hypothetical protein